MLFAVHLLQFLQKICTLFLKYEFIFTGLQYAYLNGGNNNNDSPNKKESNTDPKESKGARSEITLDELDDLYKSEEAEKEAEQASKRLMMASHSNLHTTSIKVNSSTPPPIVRMRSRDDVRSNNKAKKINRLSRKLILFYFFYYQHQISMGTFINDVLVQGTNQFGTFLTTTSSFADIFVKKQLLSNT